MSGRAASDMNEAGDKLKDHGSDQAQRAEAEPQVRQVSEDELRTICEAHQKWLLSGGREGEKADLSAANLQGANLAGANLQGASLMRAKLQEAQLHGCELQTANLQDADLSGATGLLAKQLAGANLSGARLPEDLQRFDGLERVQEACQNARTLLLSILLASVYTWLTIATTTDAALLTNSSSSPLPIIQTEISIANVYLIAPLLLLCLYLYFHIYMQRVWERLAQLPAIFSDGTPLDEKAYPWLFIGLVRSHVKLLRRDRPPLSRTQAGLSFLLAWWTVPLTMMALWGRYLSRHDLMGTFLQIFVITIAFSAALTFHRLTRETLRLKFQRYITMDNRKIGLRPYGRLAMISAMIFVLLSTAGGLIFLSIKAIGGEIRANLRDADVSTKPENWTGQDSEIQFVRGASLRKADLRHARATNAFLVNADMEWADLREAWMDEADLRKADLSYAKLDGAQLIDVNLRHANLQRASCSGTDFQTSDLSGANLSGARLSSANLNRVNFQDSILERAYLEGASLWGVIGLEAYQVRRAWNWPLALYSYTDMAGSDLEESRLIEFGLASGHSAREEKLLSKLGLSSDHRVRLRMKNFSGYDLGGALFLRADLSEFDLTKANLQEAILLGADLQRAVLEGANLKGANLGNQTDFPGGGGITLSHGSNLRDAKLRNTILDGADLRGVQHLTQDQIDEACVDKQTKLPRGLKRPGPCGTSEREQAQE